MKLLTSTREASVTMLESDEATFRGSAADDDLCGDDGGTVAAEAIGGPRTPEAASASLRGALAFGLAALAAMAGLVGWLGVQAYDVTQQQNQRAAFLAAGRAGVLQLTTISDADVESKAKQILDSSTGPFHEDFEKRSPSFVETVKRARSVTVGTVVEAGLESVTDDRADVLVAVSVKTALAGTEAPPRMWRMRIGLQQAGETIKVSNVEFVP